MNHYSRNKEYLFFILCGVIAAVILAGTFAIVTSRAESSYEIAIDYPEHWDYDYSESADDYKVIENNIIVENFYTTQEFDTDIIGTQFKESYTSKSSASAQTSLDKDIALLSENDAWALVSDGMWTSYPKGSFAQNKSKLLQLKQSNTVIITVDCWYWSNPNDETDLTKVSAQKKFAVNSALADTFVHIFKDIYNDPSKPVLNLADKGMGTWVVRGKNHNDANTMSSHALGCAIDINPSTGSFKINGKWYGNGYKHSVMSYAIWQQLPECHTKYHVLYDGCPIVEIFKSYGFYWGGDWNSSKDCMHLAYIGDGSNARATGIANYKSHQ